MGRRVVAGAILGWAVALTGLGGGARASDPPVEVARAGRGAVVVALGDDATAAAQSLARLVYREAALRPSIDDATARVLAGEPLAGNPSPALRELAELRGGIPRSASDIGGRRLLASIGADLRAVLVIGVAIEEGKPIARVMQVASASYESVLLSAMVALPPEPPEASGAGSPPGAPPAAGARPPAIAWPGAVKAIGALLGAPGAGAGAVGRKAPKAASPKAAAPKAASGGERAHPGAPKDTAGSLLTSPWFWGSLGAVATVGVTLFVIAKSTEGDDGMLRLQGRVPP